MVRILVGDCREVMATLDDESVQCAVTSPPYYGLRDYDLPPSPWDGWRGCLGAEPSIEMYVEHLVEVFRGVRRVLRNDGTVWLNLGDSYAGSTPGTGIMEPVTWTGADGKVKKAGMTRVGPVPGLKPKDLCMIPARVALALQADGWWLRSQIIWEKPNCMPRSVTDRPTDNYEIVYLLSKSQQYFYDHVAILEPSTGQSVQASNFARESRDCAGPGQSATQHRADREPTNDTGTRNKRAVWTIPTFPYKSAHFATFPPALVEPMIRAGTSEAGCCPRCGAAWERVMEKSQAVDWRPACACPTAEPVPCTVLDPFGGAGTTGLVADRLGRDAVLIELNPEYAEMARERIVGDAPMFADVRVEYPLQRTLGG